MQLAGSIEMWLTLGSGDDDWALGNARLVYQNHAQRMLFDTALPLRKVLVPAVADCLLGYLDTSRETAVFSHRDLKLDVDGLRTKGLRVLTRFDGEGGATANIRLMSTDGDMTAIFVPEYRTNVPPAAKLPAPAQTSGPVTISSAPALPQVEDVTIPVLQDLLYPALEVLDHILEHGLSEENAQVLAARVKTMRAKRDELSDYASLLSRFVEASDSRRSLTIDGTTAPDWRQHVTTRHPLAGRSVAWDPLHGCRRGEDTRILHAHHLTSEVDQ